MKKVTLILASVLLPCSVFAGSHMLGSNVNYYTLNGGTVALIKPLTNTKNLSFNQNANRTQFTAKLNSFGNSEGTFQVNVSMQPISSDICSVTLKIGDFYQPKKPLAVSGHCTASISGSGTKYMLSVEPSASGN